MYWAGGIPLNDPVLAWYLLCTTSSDDAPLTEESCDRHDLASCDPDRFEGKLPLTIREAKTDGSVPNSTHCNGASE